MIERKAELVALDGHRFESRPAIHHVLFPVGLGQSPECQPAPDLLFVLGVDVFEVPDVADDGHAGVGHRLGGGLRLPELTNHLGVAAVVVGRDLHEVEREITLAPHLPPATNQRFGMLGIHHPLAAVRLALIPDRPAQGEGLDRMDHPVVKRGRVLHVMRRLQFRRVGRHRRDECAFGQRLPAFGQPLLGGFQHLLQPLLMARGAWIAQFHQLEFLLQGRHGGKPFRRRPRLDARAAPA